MRKVYLALILALAAITVLGISIGAYIMEQRNTDVTDVVVLHDDRTHTEKEVHLAEMAPGEPVSYTIDLKSDPGESYLVTLSFLKGQETDLVQYVSVCVSLGEEIIAEMSLTDALDGASIEFSTTFSTEEASRLSIVYIMEEHVGNEAQGKCADLSIVLSAEKQ